MYNANKVEVHANVMEVRAKRRECNNAIMNKLSVYLRDNDVDFVTALRNLGIDTNYYMEKSSVTFERVNK